VHIRARLHYLRHQRACIDRAIQALEQLEHLQDKGIHTGHLVLDPLGGSNVVPLRRDNTPPPTEPCRPSELLRVVNLRRRFEW
jgi:hypothetical protein